MNTLNSLELIPPSSFPLSLLRSTVQRVGGRKGCVTDFSWGKVSEGSLVLGSLGPRDEVREKVCSVTRAEVGATF